jgi:outer membrane murein-binding lipoprotein Lpp
MRVLKPAVVVAALLLSGCATEPLPVAPPSDSPVMVELAAHARKASEAVQRLATIQGQAANVQYADIDVPAGLEKPITVGNGRSWSGELDALVRYVARESGYSFDGIIGARPATPVIVTVSAISTPAIDVLNNAGAQAGSAADIIVRPSSKTILVKYPPIVRSGPEPVRKDPLTK